MQQKSRVTNLSTRYLVAYKTSGYVFITVTAIALSYYTFTNETRFFSSLFSVGYFSYGLYKWWQINRHVFHVEFDDEFLYLILRRNDILIPLENIKDINISTLSGIWRVDLYNREQIGDKFYFKPSLLYPFNAKKKDELVNVLWQNINKSKMKQPHFQRNALHS